MIRRQKIRIFVRNKARYNPESKERDFLYVDIQDFAGTTVGYIKEDVRRQCKNSLRINELFLNNQPLADDRSVAHYNLQDGSILETTSNPFWVACLYIKAAEVKQEQEGNPDDDKVQKWTQKSLPKKYTLIGLLLNSKNEFPRQPQHFANLAEFVDYLENLNKKGATMHPNYTQKDLRTMEAEYLRDFVGRYEDPLAVFLDHHALRLGLLRPDDIGGDKLQLARTVQQPAPRGATRAGNRAQDRFCEDCEGSCAEVYCSDCQGGLALCRGCSRVLHTGVSRRNHNVQDINAAPKNKRHYVPRAFLAPFAIVVALYSGLLEGRLSLSETEIKTRAQPLTDTDLQDKQTGKYVGGFDCMENMLMAKGLVKKEAARTPTFALSESGQTLGEKLYLFYTEVTTFLTSCRLPKMYNCKSSSVFGRRKLCLIIDEKERDKVRLMQYAQEKNIDIQVRFLPAGDYIWILTPPLDNTHLPYTGQDATHEQVLPLVVERKSWEDLENSIHSNRFQRQVNNMLASGVKNCFYLVEGSSTSTRHGNNHYQQHNLKAHLHRLTMEYGFYVNYTSSWMKSAQWLLWVTGLLIDALNDDRLRDRFVPYSEFSSRVARHCGAAASNEAFRGASKETRTWTAQLFVDHIFRDNLGEGTLLSAVETMVDHRENERTLLIVQGLEQYNKSRQSTLTKCCEAVTAAPPEARTIVRDRLGACLHNLVHYDITSFWQLYIQVYTGVYVMRTENDADTRNLRTDFLSGPRGPPPNFPTKTVKQTGPMRVKTSTADLPPVIDNQIRDRSEVKTVVAKRNVKIDPFRAIAASLGHIPDTESETQAGLANAGTPAAAAREHETISGTGLVGHVIRTPRATRSIETSARSQQNVVKDDLSTDLGNSVLPFSGRGYSLGSTKPTDTASNKCKDCIGAVADTFDTFKQSDVRSVKSFQSLHSDNRSRDHVNGGAVNFADTVHAVRRSGGDSVDVGITGSRNSGKSDNISKRPGCGSDVPLNCVGTRTNDDGLQCFRIESEDEGTEIAVSSIGAGSGSGLLGGGGRSDSGQQQTGTQLTVGDFVDSQHEEDILQKVLQDSKNDVGDLTTDSQEDELVRLALELSKAESSARKAMSPNRAFVKVHPAVDSAQTHASASTHGVHIDLDREFDTEDGSDHDSLPDNEADQIKLAIELSKVETPKKLDVKNEDDMEKALQLSMIETPKKLIGDTDDELEKALKLSMRDTQRISAGNADDAIENPFLISKIKTPKKEIEDPDAELNLAIELSKQDKTTDDDNTGEEAELKLALHLSKMETPEKKSPLVGESDNELKLALELSKLEAVKVKAQNVHEMDVSCSRLKGISAFSTSQQTCTRGENNPMKNRKRKLSESSKNDKSDRYTCTVQVDLTAERSNVTGVKDFNIVSNETIDNCSEIKREQGAQYVNKNKVHACEESEVIVIDSQSQEFDKEESDDNMDEVEPEPNELDDLAGEVDNRHVKSEGWDEDYESAKQGKQKERLHDRHNEKQTFDDEVSLSLYQKYESKTDKCSLQKKVLVSRDDLEYSENLVPPSPQKSLGKLDLRSPCFISSGSCLFRNVSQKSSPCQNVSGVDTVGHVLNLSGRSSDQQKQCLSTEKTILSRDRKTVSQDGEYFSQPRDRVCQNEKFDLKRNLLALDSDSESDGAEESEEDIFEDVVCSSRKDLNSTKVCHRVSDNLQSEWHSGQNVSRISCVQEGKGDIVHCRRTCVKKENDSCDSTNPVFNSFQNTVKALEHHPSDSEDENEYDMKPPNPDKGKINDNLRDQDVSEGNEDFIEHSNEFHQFENNSYDLDFEHDTGVDFHPGSQESDDKVESDGEDELEEKASEILGEDYLPVIKRPRMATYRQHMNTEDRQSVKNENKVDIKTRDNTGKTDAEIAQMLQEELDKEAKMKEPTKNIDDELIARYLDAQWNNPPSNNVETVEHPHSNNDIADDLTAENVTMIDEELARQLDAELNKKPVEIKRIDPAEIEVSASSDVTTVETSGALDRWEDVRRGNDEGADLVRELQRKELEKIERWRKVIEADGLLAQRVQSLPDDTSSSTDMSQREATPTETSFKKMVSQHRVSREKAVAQLNEYRRLQALRYQTGGLESQETLVRGNTQSQPIATVTGHVTHINQSQPYLGGNGALVNQSQTAARNHVTQTNQLDAVQVKHLEAGGIDSGKNKQSVSQSTTDDSAMKLLSQSGRSDDGKKNQNVKCGNCQQIGHTRIHSVCPRYHTAEETARRQAKIEKMKQQKEEKQKQETETLEMLTDHQRVLEEMTTQIQTEMSTIQTTLQQRAKDLEKQVNSRVKKMEKYKKKK